MSQDPHCHNESKYHRGQGALTSSGAPDSRVCSFKGDVVKINDTNKALKVKRRKTKKERDNTKFKSHTEIFKKIAFPRGVLQRNNTVRKMVSQSAMKDTCNTRQVFITENRLTYHQGIFNREIKSVDVGRIVNQATEEDPTKTGIAQCTVESIRKTPQSQRKLSPTQELENQDVHSPQKEYSTEPTTHISEPASCNKQDEEIEVHQSCPQSDDCSNLGSGSTTSCRYQPSPILETAKSIVSMLNTHSIFPNRNLVSESRQAILEKVRHLRDRNPTPSAVPVPRPPEHNQIGNVHMHEYQVWECVGTEETNIEKTVPKSQRASQQIQTTAIRFLPLQRDSPAYTLTKMASPDDHLKLKNILLQPTHYGSDPSHQYQQISSQNPPNMLNMNTSSHYPKLSRQDRDPTSFCKVRNAGKMHSSPLNAYSPKIRWKLTKDVPTDPSYTGYVPSCNIQQILTCDNDQECVSRPLLEDISSEALNLSRVRIKQHFSDDNQTSSDVFWGNRDQRSSTTKILDISPATIKLSYREQSPHRTYSASNFVSHHSVFLPRPVSGNNGSPDVFPLDSLRRETKMSSWQEADIEQDRGMFTTNTVPKRRHLHQSRYLNLGNTPLFLHEQPKHSVHLEKDGDIEWIHKKDWPHRSHVEHYSQQRNMSIALSPQSVQQESSFVPFPYVKSSRNVLISRSSPDTWVYPRMKLY